MGSRRTPIRQGISDGDRFPGEGPPAAQRGGAGGGRGVFRPGGAHGVRGARVRGQPRSAQDGVARPELKSYFTSRGACMGQVPGEVVAAAFGASTRRWSCRRSRPGGRSPAGRPSSQAREQGATGDAAAGPRRPARGPRPGHRPAPPGRRRGPVGRPPDLSGDCARSASPATRWATCGGPRTCCASTAATATSSPGRSAAPTRWRSCC